MIQHAVNCKHKTFFNKATTTNDNALCYMLLLLIASDLTNEINVKVTPLKLLLLSYCVTSSHLFTLEGVPVITP